MTTSVLKRRRGFAEGWSGQLGERGVWVCENCQARTAWPRKRCADCGTLRY